MERTAALKKLRKLLGDSLGYRVDPTAPTAEEREEARLRLPELIAARTQAENAMSDRREAILAADAEYQRLRAAYQSARDLTDKTSGLSYQYRFTVGTSSGMFFRVKAQGDSWEQVIEEVRRKGA